MILVKEGVYTNHSSALARYFIGYGALLEQQMHVYDINASNWKYLIPKEMERRKLKEMEKVFSGNAEAQKNSKIAWRYNKMNITFDKIALRSDYTVLDLSKNRKEEYMKMETHSVDEYESFNDFQTELLRDFEAALESPTDTSTKRFVIFNLFNVFNSKFSDKMKFAKMLRRATQCSHSIVFFHVAESDFASPHEMSTFDSFFDFVLNITPLHNNKLFSDFQGTVSFERTKPVNYFLEFPLKHIHYGIKNDKSCLQIELLYENSIAHTDETNEDNQLVCGGGKPAGNLKEYEF